MDFGGQTTCINILVVIVLPGREVFSEATPAQPCERSTDTHGAIADRQTRRHDAIGLIIGAVCTAQGKRRRRTDPLGHIFDRAADCVAAIERPLWSAQHFDPFDIIDVQNRCLRPVEIDIVEIETHAGFEPRNRVLLADTTDEGR